MLKLFPLLMLGTVLTMALFGAALAATLTAFHFVGIFHDGIEAKQHLVATGGRGGRELEMQAVKSQDTTSTIGSEPTSLSLEAFEEVANTRRGDDSTWKQCQQCSSEICGI